jgi:hypothetical protein
METPGSPPSGPTSAAASSSSIYMRTQHLAYQLIMLGGCQPEFY